MAKKSNVFDPKKLDPEFRKKYIQNIQGKEYITFRGLVTLGHDQGMKSMKEEIMQFPSKDNNFTTFAKGVVVDADGNEWIGIGDANANNCNSKIAAHAPRMAGTRALGRALRHMVGIDMVMFEELQSPWEFKPMTKTQTTHIADLMKQYNIAKEQMQALMITRCHKTNSKDLSEDDGWELISALEELVKAGAAATLQNMTSQPAPQNATPAPTPEPAPAVPSEVEAPLPGAPE